MIRVMNFCVIDSIREIIQSIFTFTIGAAWPSGLLISYYGNTKNATVYCYVVYGGLIKRVRNSNEVVSVAQPQEDGKHYAC